jgi:hypothetical protein
VLRSIPTGNSKDGWRNDLPNRVFDRVFKVPERKLYRCTDSGLMHLDNDYILPFNETKSSS